MATKPTHPRRADSDNMADQAALWLARRDRGLTPAEQDEYMQWLAADPRHAAVLVQHAAAFERMMRLYEWQPGQSADANPDLFAPRKSYRWGRWGMTLAAAAVVVVGGALMWRNDPAAAPVVPQRTFLRVNETQALPDGSVVELKDGSRIFVAFSSGERRVRLSGEAHFKVAKNPVPFVVQVGSVVVRAVGTTFNVRAETELVEVLVTEGKVAVQQDADRGPRTTDDEPQTTDFGPRTADSVTSVNVPDPPLATREGRSGEVAASSIHRSSSADVLILAGQRGVVPLAVGTELRVSDVTGEEMKAALAWKVPRLQFFETPLAVAVAEFNQRSRVRLVLGQRELEGLPIGGTFGIDNVEGFVRLLEITLDLRAARRGDDEILLTRRR